MRHRMGNHCYSTLCQGLPAGRSQRVKVVAGGHLRQAGEDVAQISERIEAAALTEMNLAGQPKHGEDQRANE